MKHLITTILFLIVLTCNAQDFGTIYTTGNWTPDDIEKDLDKQFEKARSGKIILSHEKNLSGDTLVYLVQDSIVGFTLKCTFNVKEPDELYCAYQQYIFDCTPCAQKALIVFTTQYNFIKESENVYMSGYTYKTKMIVEHRSTDKSCLVITFRHLDLAKKEYKERYKSLKKKNG